MKKKFAFGAVKMQKMKIEKRYNLIYCFPMAPNEVIFL